MKFLKKFLILSCCIIKAKGEFMSDQQTQMPVTSMPKKKVIGSRDTEILQRLMANDPTHKTFTKLAIGFIVMAIVFIGSITTIGLYTNKTIRLMHEQYIRDTESVIVTRSDIEASNVWERLPANEQKERLRTQFFQIARYYTNSVTDENRLADEAILLLFNTLWDTTTRVPSVNFFLPVAYIKVASNFNPFYNVEFKYGLTAFFNRTGETTAQLSIIRNDPVFQLEYSGIDTLNNPTSAAKLLVARIDDLMTVFNNRVDWVLLSLFTNEYDVIDRYWDGGTGAIPDEVYQTGNVAKSLEFFYAFKNWQIPAIEEIISEAPSS